MRALALLASPVCDACVAQFTGLSPGYVCGVCHALAKEDVVLRYYQRVCRQCGKRRRVNELAAAWALGSTSKSVTIGNTASHSERLNDGL